MASQEIGIATARTARAVASAIEQGHHDLGLRSQSPRQPAGTARSAELAESLLQIVGVHYRDDLHLWVERHEVGERRL